MEDLITKVVGFSQQKGKRRRERRQGRDKLGGCFLIAEASLGGKVDNLIVQNSPGIAPATPATLSRISP